jgi:hypothetical protein
MLSEMVVNFSSRSTNIPLGQACCVKSVSPWKLRNVLRQEDMLHIQLRNPAFWLVCLALKCMLVKFGMGKDGLW